MTEREDVGRDEDDLTWNKIYIATNICSFIMREQPKQC